MVSLDEILKSEIVLLDRCGLKIEDEGNYGFAWETYEDTDFASLNVNTIRKEIKEARRCIRVLALPNVFRRLARNPFASANG